MAVVRSANSGRVVTVVERTAVVTTIGGRACDNTGGAVTEVKKKLAQLPDHDRLNNEGPSTV